MIFAGSGCKKFSILTSGSNCLIETDWWFFCFFSEFLWLDYFEAECFRVYILLIAFLSLRIYWFIVLAWFCWALYCSMCELLFLRSAEGLLLDLGSLKYVTVFILLCSAPGNLGGRRLREELDDCCFSSLRSRFCRSVSLPKVSTELLFVILWSSRC